jgi:hypothetical protein
MSNAVEYLFAADIRMADRAARLHGWNPHGRTGWIKPDGGEVHFICFKEQLSVVGRDVKVSRPARDVGFEGSVLLRKRT